MSELEQIRQRVDTIEKEIASLKRQRQRPDALPGWENLDGIAADCPEFDEVIRLGREFRNQDKPKPYSRAMYLLDTDYIGIRRVGVAH